MSAFRSMNLLCLLHNLLQSFQGRKDNREHLNSSIDFCTNLHCSFGKNPVEERYWLRSERVVSLEARGLQLGSLTQARTLYPNPVEKFSHLILIIDLGRKFAASSMGNICWIEIKKADKNLFYLVGTYHQLPYLHWGRLQHGQTTTANIPSKNRKQSKRIKVPSGFLIKQWKNKINLWWIQDLDRGTP